MGLAIFLSQCNTGGNFQSIIIPNLNITFFFHGFIDFTISHTINHYEILDVSDPEEGWWNLLKRLLEEEEVGKQSVLHHAVATELLHYSTSLPTWLSDSYKVSQSIGFGVFDHPLVHS